jgi:hypothetical protein
MSTLERASAHGIVSGKSRQRREQLLGMDGSYLERSGETKCVDQL